MKALYMLLVFVAALAIVILIFLAQGSQPLLIGLIAVATGLVLATIKYDGKPL